MVYSKKFFDKGDRIPHYLKDVRSEGRRITKVSTKYQSFQMKYTFYLLAAVAGASFIFVLPAWYFLRENYVMFSKLAFDTHPALLEHLEREVTHLYFLFGFSLLSILGFSAWIGLRVTSKIVNPLIAMDAHMKKVSVGNWKDEDFKIRANDDFRQLANSYSYLYRSLRAGAIADLENIERIQVDPQNKESYTAWYSMLSQKRNALGLTEIQEPNASSSSDGEAGSESSSTRRAS